MAILVLHQYMACFFHLLPKQMLTLDKIFMTVSSTAFVHMRCCNQRKIKVPWRDFKSFFFSAERSETEVCLSFLLTVNSLHTWKCLNAALSNNYPWMIKHTADKGEKMSQRRVHFKANILSILSIFTLFQISAFSLFFPVMGLFNNLMRIFPRGGHGDDLLQHSSAVARQNGFCSSFHRGQLWLISVALEAHANINTHHTGHPHRTEPGQAELHSTGLVKRTGSLQRVFENKDDFYQTGTCVGQRHHHSVIAATSGLRTRTMFCLWSGASVAELDCAAPPHCDKPGLWAMSLLSALSLVCGFVLHVSFCALNSHYCVPRKTVPYQSKSHHLNASTPMCHFWHILTVQ